MARHAQVNSDTYKDLRQEGFSHKAIYVYLYYTITSENLIGLYRVIPEDDRVSMGYPAKDYKKAKGELEEKRKLVFREGWLWIPGKAKKVNGPKQIQAACKLLKELEAPQSLKAEIAKKYPNLGYPIDGVSPVALPIPIPIPKEKKEKTSPDKRVGRLLSFFGFTFKDVFAVNYKPNFAGDSKIIKDQLRYADKSYPEGRGEIALAVTMNDWLGKQKELGTFKKTTIPGWLKDFNSINTDVDWDGVEWAEIEKEYENDQKRIKEDQNLQNSRPPKDTPVDAPVSK